LDCACAKLNGALAGTHSGDTVSTRRVLDAIDTDEHGSVQRLLVEVGERNVNEPDASAPFNFAHAQSKLEVLAMLALEPRDVRTGQRVQPIELFGSTQDEGGAALPRLFTAPHQKQADTHRSVVNRLVHPEVERLKAALKEAANGDALFGEVDAHMLLRSHGIDDDASRALALGDADAFFEARRRFLKAHLSSFFAARAKWSDNDRPPIEALIVEDESA
jgi:hypothetical protein